MLWKKDVCLVVQVGGDVVHAGQLSAAAGRIFLWNEGLIIALLLQQ